MKKKKLNTFIKNIAYALLVVVCAFSVTSFLFPEVTESLLALAGLGGSGIGGASMATTVMATNTRASTVAARPKTTTDPGHLAEDVSKFVTMIMPDDFALDTLLREANQSEKATDLIVNFEEVEFRAHQDQIGAAYTGVSAAYADITVDNPNLWVKGESIYIPTVNALGNKPLNLRIDSINPNGTLKVTAINTASNFVPTIANDTVIYRGPTAHGEKKARAENKSLIPANRFNYCQRFMAQVDEGFIRGMLDTKSGYSFKDQNFIRMYDFRTELAKAGYFGQKFITPSTEEGENIYYTEGIFHQLTKQLDWTAAGGITNNMWIDWCNALFADNAGAKDRYVMAGRNLIAAISKIPDVQKQLDGKETTVVAGVKLSKIETLFGELYIKHDKIFDIMGHADDGIVMDLTQIRKRPFLPLTSRQLKLREAGIENTNATLIEEIMCLETRYLGTHARIKKTA